MEAKEFVKKFGWDYASKKDVWFYFGCSSERSFQEIYGFLLSDLKNLVEAWELVGAYGGLDNAKHFIKHHRSDRLSLQMAINLMEQVND